jgi:hypothetical protein
MTCKEEMELNRAWDALIESGSSIYKFRELMKENATLYSKESVEHVNQLADTIQIHQAKTRHALRELTDMFREK